MAWQVKVTLSPSRTERGSMDRVTIGGSTEGNIHIQCTREKLNDYVNECCAAPSSIRIVYILYTIHFPIKSGVP